MRADDGTEYTWSAAGASPSFVLVGGRYVMFGLSADWNGGNVELQALGPDGSTFLKVGDDISANGSQVVDLAPGEYQFGVTTTAAGSASLGRVPND